MELAERKNSIPLPLVPDKFGMRLPPERNTLIKQNFQIVPKLHPTKRPATAPMSQYASPLIKRQQLGSFDPAQPVAMQPGFGMPAGMPVPMQMPATGIPQLGQQAQLGDLAPGGGAAAGAMGQMNPMAQMAQMAQMGPMGDNSALMTFGAPVPSAMPAGAGAQQFGMAGMGMGGMGAGMGMNMGMGMGMQPALGAGVQHQTAVTSMGLAMPEVGAPAQPKEDDDYDMDAE
nr:hypothetical protein HK105_007047 [Polyrhizophydium stewartii]